MRGTGLNLKGQILDRMEQAAPFGAWTPVDFLDLGTRDTVDQALHRLTRAKQIRRFARGLYDKPKTNSLTGKLTNPDSRAVIDALSRRDQTRMLIDGLTAANDLGLTNAVPAKIVIHTDARLKSLKLGNLVIVFRKTAPSKLYWVGRPAMRVVQALHWLQDVLPQDSERIRAQLRIVFGHPDHGAAMVEDLHRGMHTLPAWMHDFLRDILGRP
ncbi:DUF6088 family protein [Sphingomonas sp.]|uniref:DUF6088 family protein n=1 Tax=Sphingomonas sp. TaxID=28214 RepID=UPI0025EB701D|nr:DUF6088 family protein [Sphingomonas sp.]